MLTENQLEFIKTHKDLLESNTLISDLYNIAAPYMSMRAARSLVILWAEAKGNYGFRVTVQEVKPGDQHRYIFEIVNLNSSNDRIVTSITLPTREKYGPVEQEKLLRSHISDYIGDSGKLKNLFNNTEYLITDN